MGEQSVLLPSFKSIFDRFVLTCSAGHTESGGSGIWSCSSRGSRDRGSDRSVEEYLGDYRLRMTLYIKMEMSRSSATCEPFPRLGV